MTSSGVTQEMDEMESQFGFGDRMGTGEEKEKPSSPDGIEPNREIEQATPTR